MCEDSGLRGTDCRSILACHVPVPPSYICVKSCISVFRVAVLPWMERQSVPRSGLSACPLRQCSAQVCVKVFLSGFRVAAGLASIMEGIRLQYGGDAPPLPRACYLHLRAVASSFPIASSSRHLINLPTLPRSTCAPGLRQILRFRVSRGRWAPVHYGQRSHLLPCSMLSALIFAFASSFPLESSRVALLPYAVPPQMLPRQISVKSSFSGFRVAAGRPSIMGIRLHHGRSNHSTAKIMLSACVYNWLFLRFCVQ